MITCGCIAHSSCPPRRSWFPNKPRPCIWPPRSFLTSRVTRSTDDLARGKHPRDHEGHSDRRATELRAFDSSIDNSVKKVVPRLPILKVERQKIATQIEAIF